MQRRVLTACAIALPVLLILLNLAQVHAAAVPPSSSVLTPRATPKKESEYEPKWVGGPRNRGTFGLVFSCVITLFLCAWTTVHVNIEPENEINHTLYRFLPIRGVMDNDRLGRFLASRSIRKLGWGCVTLIVPEGAMAIATYERKTARLLRHAVNAVPRDGEGGEWDMTLAYYAVMGGFVLREADYDAAKRHIDGNHGADKEKEGMKAAAADPKTAVKTTTIDEKNGETGTRPETSSSNTGSKTTNKPLVLTPHGVVQLARWKLLPHIRSAEVRDKSNANSLAKAIVFWQALWMIIQVIGRTAGNLPVTLLELHTVLHTFCAVAMYITWWNKPVDIDLPTEVRLDRHHIQLLIEGTDDPDPTNPLNTRPTTPPPTGKSEVDASGTNARNPATNDDITREETAAPPIDDDDASSHHRIHGDEAPHAYLTTRAGLGKYMVRSLFGYSKSARTDYFTALGTAYKRLWSGRNNVKLEGLSISFVGLVYGGTHLAAWNNTFPSVAERRLWQISAAITASAYSMFVLSLWISVALEGKGYRGHRRLLSKSCGVFFGVGIFPCVLVRFYLLVESFASIRKLPLGSYALNNWSNDIPHAA